MSTSLSGYRRESILFSLLLCATGYCWTLKISQPEEAIYLKENLGITFQKTSVLA